MVKSSWVGRIILCQAALLVHRQGSGSFKDIFFDPSSFAFGSNIKMYGRIRQQNSTPNHVGCLNAILA